MYFSKRSLLVYEYTWRTQRQILFEIIFNFRVENETSKSPRDLIGFYYTPLILSSIQSS